MISKRQERREDHEETLAFENLESIGSFCAFVIGIAAGWICFLDEIMFKFLLCILKWMRK